MCTYTFTCTNTYTHTYQPQVILANHHRPDLKRKPEKGRVRQPARVKAKEGKVDGNLVAEVITNFRYWLVQAIMGVLPQSEDRQETLRAQGPRPLGAQPD